LIRIPKLALEISSHIAASDTFFAQTRRYLEDYVIQRKMNKQSGFNAEQIEKDKYPESKNRLKIKSKITGR
jgi:hypothetical protein